jgi:hypothetical protein
VVDADVHCVVPGYQALFPYLAEHWREYMTQSAFKGPGEPSYPRGAPTSARPGSAPPGGGPAGSDLDTLRQQVLDLFGVALGILTCTYGLESVHNPDAAAALATAVNEWQSEQWLEREPRLRGSIVVPSQQPEMAAREIERIGGSRGFVQVILPVRSRTLYGNRQYHPVFEAAARHNLAVAIHYGGASGMAPTPAGWPSYHIEDYVGMAQVAQSQMMNLIAEGVFDRFPTTRVVFAECGWAWVPPWMWRMDKEWKGLRSEIPWVKRPPSDYVREHMRFTLQPVEAADAVEFEQLVEHMGSEDLLMFSTDFPHWHFDAPHKALPAGLPDGLRRRILSENARAFYRL